MVKVQFRGLELFRKNGTLFEEESYLAKICRPFSFTYFSLCLQCILMPNFLSYAWQVDHQRSARSPYFDRDHDVTMQVHDSSQPITQSVTPRAGDAVDKLTASCHVDTMAAVSWSYAAKKVKISSEWRPSVHNRINNLSKKVYRYCVDKILLEIMHPFLKSSSPLNCTFTHCIDILYHNYLTLSIVHEINKWQLRKNGF